MRRPIWGRTAATAVAVFSSDGSGQCWGSLFFFPALSARASACYGCQRSKPNSQAKLVARQYRKKKTGMEEEERNEEKETTGNDYLPSVASPVPASVSKAHPTLNNVASNLCPPPSPFPIKIRESTNEVITPRAYGSHHVHHLLDSISAEKSQLMPQLSSSSIN